MASASIESVVTAPAPKPTVTDESRDDLDVGDVVELDSVNLGTAYTWSLAYVPEGSAATFSGSEFDKSPGSFTVDLPGPYLVRLVLEVPTVVVVAVPILPGVTLTIDGVVLTAVNGARTSGSNNFNGNLGTAVLVAAEIVAALSDGANGFAAIVAPTVAGGSTSINLNPVVGGVAFPIVSSSLLLVPYPTAVSEQFVRLRALTAVGSLKLVAAGERVDTVPVPVDITAEGWADEQNYNLLTLLGMVASTNSSGRVLYVDPSSGDYNTIQDAIDAAQAAVPSITSQWVVLVRPGTYQEDLIFYPFVHVFGWPGGKGTRTVRIRAASDTGHSVSLGLATDTLTLSNLYFDATASTPNPLLSVSGDGALTMLGCEMVTGGADNPQGPLVEVAGTVVLRARDSKFTGSGASSLTSFTVLVESGATAYLDRCEFSVRGVDAAAGAYLHLRDCEILVTGNYGVRSSGIEMTIDYSSVSGGVLQDLGFNPTGAAVAGALAVSIHWSKYDDLIFDTTGVVGATSLLQGSNIHGTHTFPGGDPATLTASTVGDTLYFDNTTTGIVAETVQDALDEIYAFAAMVRTLDDAYDGGDPGPTGSGRTIVADAGAVQIVDAASPSDPIPVNNPNGGLDVVGRVHIGALTKPEISLDPNPYGNGPEILLGHEIYANDAPNGSTALVLGDSVSGRNYNLQVGTKSVAGGTRIGRVLVRAGDSLVNGVTAGPVFVQAGSGAAGIEDGGSLYLAPGASLGGSEGSIFLVRGQDGTPATLTAGGAFVGGVSGLIRFATNFGAIEVNVDSGDNLAAVLAKFDATDLVTAADSGGGVIQLTTLATGVTAEVFFLNADTGVDAALGGFSGETMVDGTWPSFMEVQVSGANEITFGPNDPFPVTFNTTTGAGTAVSQEEIPAASFTFAAGISSFTLSDTPSTVPALQGSILVFANGIANMTNVGPGAPASATQYRILAGDLEIGTDITASGNTYRIVYPSV